MPTLIFRFPGRRYHATPWGHHVNEGLVEWPPSPWRLLRALLATGYAKLDWPADGPPELARGLICKLATVLPHYRLPPAVGAHSRHYMPLARFKNGREETTLVFDTWARVDDAELAVTWDVRLTDAETGLLAELAAHMHYLGRSESWVFAHLAQSDHPLCDANCFPCAGREMPGPGWEQVPILAAMPEEDYTSWRQTSLASELAGLPAQPAGRKPTRKILEARARAEAPYPADLIASLQTTTDELRKYGWSQPPGSRRVFYWRGADSLEAGAPRPRAAQRRSPPVKAMLLSMATASRNDHALPPITRTLPQAELLHKQLVSALKGRNHPALTGCDHEHRPLRLPHAHAHILPLDLDGDGHLEHLLIWAPMGLDAEAQSAVRAVRLTYTKGGVGPLRLAVVGAGSLQELATRLPDLSATGSRTLAGLTGHAHCASAWRSLTPFVPPRHLKPRGRDTLEGQVAAELASRGLPAPVAMRRLDPRESEETSRMRHFIRHRSRGPAPPIDCGFALELRFDKPVQGPVCLGYASHFGLGLFTAVAIGSQSPRVSTNTDQLDSSPTPA